MASSLAEIEDDALRLPPEDRARLAVDLLASLEESVESPEEIEKLWLAEAERRFRELRDGVVEGIFAPSTRKLGRKSASQWNSMRRVSTDWGSASFLRSSRRQSAFPRVPKRARRLPVAFASESSPVFRTASWIASGRTTSISLRSPTSTAARTTGVSERTAANKRVEPSGLNLAARRKRQCAAGSRARRSAA